jgi:SPX domain protein involved in polyphosphate accumulation
MTDAVVQDDMEKRTRQFIEVRDTIKRLDDEHKARVKDLKELQDKLAGRIQAFMAANSLENLKTAAGTCFLTTRTTASLSDPDAFMDYVKTNQAFDLLDRRANVTAIQKFTKKHNALPPGCNLSTIVQVGVRRRGADKVDE